MAKAHGQLPSAENAPTARAGPRYEPVGRWAVASNEGRRHLGVKLEEVATQECFRDEIGHVDLSANELDTILPLLT